MPGDLAAGCLEIVLRAVLEVLVHGLGEPLWRWCQVVGEFSVWLLTLGRIRTERRHEVLAGIVGILVHGMLIGLLVWWIMETPGVTK